MCVYVMGYIWISPERLLKSDSVCITEEETLVSKRVMQQILGGKLFWGFRKTWSFTRRSSSSSGWGWKESKRESRCKDQFVHFPTFVDPLLIFSLKTRKHIIFWQHLTWTHATHHAMMRVVKIDKKKHTNFFKVTPMIPFIAIPIIISMCISWNFLK